MQETIVFGGGCFWCTEAIFLMFKGVKSVEPGYAGPEASNGAGPTYEEVSTGATPYVESAKVVYDPDMVAFPELLGVYFASHDPTQAGGRGNDIGPHYRPAVFYTTPRQRDMAEHYIKVIGQPARPDGHSGGGRTKPIFTSVVPLVRVYKAEGYHQNYYQNHKDAGYCQLIIAPKIEKVEKKFKNLLK